MKDYSTGVPSIDMMLTLCSVKIIHLLEKLKLGYTHMDSVVISQALFLSCQE